MLDMKCFHIEIIKIVFIGNQLIGLHMQVIFLNDQKWEFSSAVTLKQSE